MRHPHVALVPTLADSGATIPYSVYYISAHSTTPSVFYSSTLDSGYSDDNVAPAPPPGLVVEYNAPGGNLLTWGPSEDEDFDYFNVYRGQQGGGAYSRAANSSVALDEPALVFSTSSAGWLDPISEGWRYEYALTVVDIHGNESEASSPEGATGVRPQDLPSRFALHQNVPNPFNPVTAIRYDIPVDGSDVTLKVYDVGGQHVRTLVDGPQTRGEKSVIWCGKNDQGQGVASGVYFYRLEAPGFNGTLKMVLLR